MPGNGTYNLTALWRALGIKNPEPSVRETIQPVIVVGDFAQLTPQHRPLTAVYGGNMAGVALEFATLQITSRAPGGTLLGLFRHDNANVVHYSQGAVQLGLTPRLPAVLQGGQNTIMLSLVEVGTLPAQPGSTGISPGLDVNSAFDFSRYPFWLSPGMNIFFWLPIAGGNINNFTLQLVDLPASQAPEA